MKRIATFLTTVFIGLLVTSTEAAELTLDDCIELALKNRASIIAARGAEQQASAGKLSALGALMPRISASYSYRKGKETEIDPPNELREPLRDTIFTNVVGGDTARDYGWVYAVQPVDEQDIGPNKSFNVQAEMAVFDPGAWFNYSGARAAHARRKLDVLASEQDLIYAVKTAFYAYLASVENVTVQEEAVKRAEEQLKLIEARYELGSASLSDVLKQKVQSGNDRLELLRAQNAVINTNASLAYTVGIDPREDHQFATDYRVSEIEGSLDEAIDFGATHNPRLLSAEKQFSESKAYVRAAASSYLPTLSAWASYSRFNGTQAFPFVFDYSSNSLTYGFGVSYNIFDGFLRERQLSDAKILRNNARAGLADTRNRFVSDVKTAYLDIEQIRQQKLVSEENVAAADEDLKITQEKYNLGAATILDLLVAQVSLKQAQVALIRVEFDLNLAIAKLENAMGKM